MKILRHVFLAAIGLWLSPATLSAQTGQMTGRVADPQGGVVVNATVVLSQTGTDRRSTRTNTDGTFTFEHVAAGMYALQADAPGFVPWRQNITVGARPAPVTITLQIAGITEDVSVVGITPTPLLRPAFTGSRLGLTPLETPASIQILPGEAIRDRGDVSVAEAKTRAVGIMAQATPGNGGGGAISRGFAGVGSVMQLYDGAQFYVASGTITFPFDTWTIDRIEVLGGPGSVLYGNGAIGGVVNIVPRKPNPFSYENSARVAFGSDNTWRGAFDTAGPINTQTSYRLDVSHNRSDGWMDRGDTQSTALSASIRRQVTGAFSLTLSEDFGHQNPQQYFGAPTINGRVVDSLRKTNYNIADADIHYKDNWTQLKAEWQPSSALRVRSGLQILTSDRFWRDVSMVTYHPTGLIRRSDYIEIFHHQRQYGNRTDAVFNRAVLGRANTVSAGFEYNHIRFEHVNNGPFGGASFVAPGNPDPGPFINLAGTTPRFRTRSNQMAVFAEDRLVLSPKLSLVGGLRTDRHAVNRLNIPERTSGDREFTPVSGRGGIVYAVTSGVSLYGQVATATDSIGNVITQSLTQQLFDLTTGWQVEAGAKQSFLKGRGEWTVAGYQIVKKKLLAPDPANPGQSLQIGQQSSRGVEATASVGARDIRVDANATFLRARFDDFAENVAGVLASRVGNTPPNVPRRAANLWVTWSATADWQLRGGLRYVGGRYWNNANTSQTPSYTVVDAAVRRKLNDKLALDLRLFNLFDEVYAATFGAGNSAAPQWLLGAPRTAEVSLGVTF